jgi:hypothetical protein
MKILKPGKTPHWTKRVRCTGNGNGGGGCKAELLVGEADLFHTSHTDYAGDTDHYITFACPCCKVWTDVSSDALPSRVSGAVLDKKPRFPRY